MVLSWRENISGGTRKKKLDITVLEHHEIKNAGVNIGNARPKKYYTLEHASYITVLVLWHVLT
jgi:hypothetical protein